MANTASRTGAAQPIHSPAPGCFVIDGVEWQVGDRYQLLRVLGYGSFGTVCLALDKTLNEQVALKRIGDVLNSPEYAKRVLRELCILRRIGPPLGHITEGIVRLKDVFLKPSATGRLVYRQGKLVATSLDVYISMEYADQGDLFAMHGQLMENEVRRLMWQLLSALQQLHAMHVWHRDVKTANVLVELRDGRRIAKLADFGSARSANDKDQAGGDGPSAEDLLDGGKSQEDVEMRQQDLHAIPAHEGGFQQALTRVVCTPCYRAPEVVMSRGQYSSAMDMWSAGCVFGELLQRIAYLGKSSTPHLQVAPVFALQGLHSTPREGDHFAEGPGNTSTRAELNTLFHVIGTPSWASIQDVPSPSWRNYLYRIPGKAPTLFRRFGAAGEAAVDLLSRLLCFDPARRCSAEEAMQHEYFGALAAERIGECQREAAAAELRAQVLAMQVALKTQQEATAARDQALAELRAREQQQRRQDDCRRSMEAIVSCSPASPPPSARGTPTGGAVGSGPSAAGATDGAAGACEDVHAAALPCQEGWTGHLPADAEPLPLLPAAVRLHFWEIADPSRALSMMEAELSADCSGPDGVDRLRGMLEREVEEHRQSRLALQAGKEQAAAKEALAAQHAARYPSPPALSSASSTRLALGDLNTDSPRSRHFFAFGDTATGWPLASEPKTLDPSNQAMQIDADSMGYERISHHADSAKAMLDPDLHLRAGRHGEWSATALEAGPRTGSVWGVSLVPPGMDAATMDPAMLAIIRSQHAR